MSPAALATMLRDHAPCCACSDTLVQAVVKCVTPDELPLPLVLKLAGLPTTLDRGDAELSTSAIADYVREQRAGTARRAPAASVLLLGPSRAGKTSLLQRLTRDTFEEGATESTNGLVIGASCIVARTHTRSGCHPHQTSTCALGSCAPGTMNVAPAGAEDGGDSATVTLRTVDMGGQEEFLHTHPLFFTDRAVYVAVTACAERDEHGERQARTVSAMAEDLRPYLRSVRARAARVAVGDGGDGDTTTWSVLVVGTKADLLPHGGRAAAEFDQATVSVLRREFGDVVQPHGLLVSSHDAWAASRTVLLQRLRGTVLASPYAQQPLPASYARLRGLLLANVTTSPGACSTTPTVARPFGDAIPVTTVAEVEAAAREHGCGLTRSPTATRTALLVMHALGVVVFGAMHEGRRVTATGDGADGVSASTASVRDLVVLDPRWLADVLKRLVTPPRFQLVHLCDGRLGYGALRTVWGEHPWRLHPALMTIMFALRVATPVVAVDGVTSLGACVVPALLPLEPPAGLHEWEEAYRQRGTVVSGAPTRLACRDVQGRNAYALARFPGATARRRTRYARGRGSAAGAGHWGGAHAPAAVVASGRAPVRVQQGWWWPHTGADTAHRAGRRGGGACGRRQC